MNDATREARFTVTPDYMLFFFPVKGRSVRRILRFERIRRCSGLL